MCMDFCLRRISACMPARISGSASSPGVGQGWPMMDGRSAPSPRKKRGVPQEGTPAGALSLATCSSPSERLAGGHPLHHWAAHGSGGRLRMEDRSVGVSHRHSRRSDRAGGHGAVYRNAFRITGHLRRRACRGVGSTAEQPAQAREESRAALLGSVRQILRRGSNGTRNGVLSGVHDWHRIGGRSARGRHEQHKRMHGCFFLETKATAPGARTEFRPSHLTRGTRGREPSLRAHRPLAAEHGAIHRPVTWAVIRAMAPRNERYGMPMVLPEGSYLFCCLPFADQPPTELEARRLIDRQSIPHSWPEKFPFSQRSLYSHQAASLSSSIAS